MKLKSILAGLLAFAFISCEEAPKETKRFDDVKAVWFHEGNSYSFSAIDENNTLINIRANNTQTSTWVKVDLPPGSKPYALVTYGTSALGVPNAIILSIEIHVASVEDINGADWNHGKLGSGTTKRIDK